MAEKLKPHKVASISLWPGFSRTEDVLAQPDVYPDLSATVSQVFSGRAVAALAADPHVINKTGETLRVNDLVTEYGLADNEGARENREQER
jgi:hypothetical protein